jgi:hypothetical protein
MEKSHMLIIAILFLVFLGLVHSNYSQQPVTTSSTTKTVVVNEQPYTRQYGYVQPLHYNAYKAQYY